MRKKRLQHTYSKEQLEFISRNRTMFRKDLAVAFNKKFDTGQSAGAIKRICVRNGWKSGRTGYEKGHTPSHKGTKGLIKKNKGTFTKGCFTKDCPNPRSRPVGSERIKGKRIAVKVAEPNVWKDKHVVVWEKAHGPVPDDHLVCTKDGNRFNCSPDNLQLISKRLLLRLNQHRYFETPEELKESVKVLSELECKVFALANN